MKILICFKDHSYNLKKKSIKKIQKIIYNFYKINKLIPLPRKLKKFSINKSPFVHSAAKSQYRYTEYNTILTYTFDKKQNKHIDYIVATVIKNIQNKSINCSIKLHSTKNALKKY